MFTVSILLLLLVGLHAVSPKALYPTTNQRPPDLLSDFQKNNISSSWAPGHPKDWTNKESLKYTFSDGGPQTYTTGGIPAAALTSDERLLVTVNASNHVSVIEIATGTTMAQFTVNTNYSGAPTALRVLVDPQGQYDVLISMDYQEIRRIRLSHNGIQLGAATAYPGGLLSDYSSPSVSHHSRQVLTAVRDLPHYNIYDLDDATVNISLSNQVAYFYDAAFSPDDQYVATRSYSSAGPLGLTRLFNTTTGSLIRDFGNTDSEIIAISPDGNLLAAPYDSEAIRIWDLRNATSGPLTLELPSKIIMPWSALTWSPDGSYLAVGAWGHLFVWKMAPDFQLVQHLQLSNYAYDVKGILWLEGSRRLAYRVFGGLEMYDFDSNLKYRWGFNPLSHWASGSYQQVWTWLVSSQRWIGGLDSDANIRFWEYPASESS
jgi:WD40 repeat protein